MSDETVTQLRETLEASQKELKKLSRANEDLVKENRALQAREALRGAELDPKLADLYLGVNPEGEIDVEAVKTFAASYGIATTKAIQEESVEDESNGAKKDPPVEEGLANIGRVGSRGGEGGQPPVGTKLLSTSEFLELQRSDPSEASKALAEGRVKLRSDNPMAVGGTSPFTARTFIPSQDG